MIPPPFAGGASSTGILIVLDKKRRLLGTAEAGEAKKWYLEAGHCPTKRWGQRKVVG